MARVIPHIALYITTLTASESSSDVEKCSETSGDRSSGLDTQQQEPQYPVRRVSSLFTVPVGSPVPYECYEGSTQYNSSPECSPPREEYCGSIAELPTEVATNSVATTNLPKTTSTDQILGQDKYSQLERIHKQGRHLRPAR
jgi:hypothetical protein